MAAKLRPRVMPPLEYGRPDGGSPRPSASAVCWAACEPGANFVTRLHELLAHSVAGGIENLPLDLIVVDFGDELPARAVRGTDRVEGALKDERVRRLVLTGAALEGRVAVHANSVHLSHAAQLLSILTGIVRTDRLQAGA